MKFRIRLAPTTFSGGAPAQRTLFSASESSPYAGGRAEPPKPKRVPAERALPGRPKAAAPAPRKPRAAEKPPSASDDSVPSSDGEDGVQTIAHELAKKQKEISVAEFFSKNRHLLGFDSPKKALLTAVKEAVDNALDACEEAKVLPDIEVEIKQLEQEDRFSLRVRDNGPGIVRAQIPRIFGKLLYGSKFHRLKMSRGQQGIGISAAGMYGQMTTGKPVRITSRISARRPAQYFEILIDTGKNEQVVAKEEEVADPGFSRGTEVELTLVGRWTKGRASVDEYLEQTAIANPHVEMVYTAPDGTKLKFPRGSKVLPAEPTEIQPHPRGIELGMLMKMLKETQSRRLSAFLHTEFSRVSTAVARRLCQTANLSDKARPKRVSHEEAERLFQAIQNSKFMNPPTDCLSPIGEPQILAGLKKEVRAHFYTAVTRPPSVYRGRPFQIEAGLAYGGEMTPKEGEETGAQEPVRLLRFANRVPLIYQQGACGITESVIDTAWRSYGLSQHKGALPLGPAVLFVHFASVWVPFTSESKEAIAHYPELTTEMKRALQEAGRRLGTYLSRRRNAETQMKRRAVFTHYVGEVASSVSRLTGEPRQALYDQLLKIAEKKTKAAELADRKVADGYDSIADLPSTIVIEEES